MSDREATSELSSSVREGAGYYEAYPSGREPEKVVPWSPERELSTHSPTEEEEEDEEDEEEEEDEKNDERRKQM